MNSVFVVKWLWCCTFLGLKTQNRRIESFINLFLLRNSLQVSKKLQSGLCYVLLKRYILFNTKLLELLYFFVSPWKQILCDHFRTTKTKAQFLLNNGCWPMKDSWLKITNTLFPGFLLISNCILFYTGTFQRELQHPAGTSEISD